MILLDTNICIYIINAKPPAVLARFQQHRLGDIGVCSVVAAELAFGVAKSGSPRNRQALEMFLAPLTILPFDTAAVWAYGDLRSDPCTRLNIRTSDGLLAFSITELGGQPRDLPQLPRHIFEPASRLLRHVLGFHRPFLELHRTLLLADQGEIQLTGTLRRRFQLFDLN